MGHLYILAPAVFHELLHVSCLYHDSHPLLGLAYGKLCGIESAVLHRHPVQIYVQSVGKFAYGYTYTSGAEIV